MVLHTSYLIAQELEKQREAAASTFIPQQQQQTLQPTSSIAETETGSIPTQYFGFPTEASEQSTTGDGHRMLYHREYGD